MTKLWEIVKSVGAGIFEDVVPGGATILRGINALLPDDKQLISTATGQDINKAIDGLDPELKAELLSKEYDVKLEHIRQSHDSLRTALSIDATCKRTTRPKIALIITYVYCFCSCVFITALSLTVYKQGATLKDVADLWLPIGTVLAPLVVVLKAYFGILRDEQANSLNAANGHQVVSKSLIDVIKRR